MDEILVIVEHRKQVLLDVSLQMLSKGRQLADRNNWGLTAIAIGSNVINFAGKLAQWADRVLVITNNNAGESLAEPCQKILGSVIKQRKPKLVMAGHSSFGMDLAPALAVEVDAPLITDCIDISIENNVISATRSLYNGKLNAKLVINTTNTVIITGRVGEFLLEESNKQGQIEEIAFDINEDSDCKQLHGYIEQPTSTVDITQTDVLVSVGRGIKDKENIKIVDTLADLLGGVVSCSRPVVDSGWLPAERQVGLSGKTVKPKLYMAVGISGSFQHMVGMKGSKMIVAINKDARAPIFNIADYGIVEDWQKILPELIKKIAELKA